MERDNNEEKGVAGILKRMEKERSSWSYKIGNYVFWTIGILFIVWFLYHALIDSGFKFFSSRYSDKAVASQLVEKNISPFEQLEKVVVEREWKYKKLEAIQYPQINTYDMLPSLDSFKNKLKSWHGNFETYRDQWCDTAFSVSQDMGTDTYITECKIEIELRAIDMLNNLYYKGVMQNTRGSRGVPDFEAY